MSFDYIISLRQEVWDKTSLAPPLYIEVPVPSQESGRSCICIRGNYFARNVSVHVFVLGVMICQECERSCIYIRGNDLPGM